MSINVAIVGHSQTPRIRSYNNVNIQVFKQPGAKIDDVYDVRSELNRVLHSNWDIVFVFLGGNDICKKPSSVVVDDLISLKHQLSSHHVYITAIEPRFYTSAQETRYRITTHHYNSKARTANTRLKRFARRYNYRNIKICPAYLYGTHDMST